MKYHTQNIVTVASILLFATAPFAFAAIKVVPIEAEAGIAAVSVPTTLRSNVNVGVTATSTPAVMKMEAGMEMERKTEEGMMHDDDGGEEMGMENAQMHADEHAMFGLETAKLHIDVRALMKEENEPGHGAGDAEVDMAAKVHSSTDFEHFVAHKAKTDSDIKEVDIKDGKVKVKYRMPAKFMGFINSSMITRAEVDVSGKVEVKYPWYHIFMKKHVSQATLRSKVAQAIAAEQNGEQESVVSTAMQATIEASLRIPNLFELIVDALKQASTEAEVKASAN